MAPYEIVAHTADLGIRVCAPSREELFTQAVEALFDVMAGRESVRPLHERTISAEGTDGEELFVNFLREALYLFHGEGMLLAECRMLDLAPRVAKALVRGEPFEDGRHVIKTELKAVTYHGVEIVQRPEGWSGKVIIDV